MYCKFLPGDRLVCVDASAPAGLPSLLVRREVYTCEKVAIASNGKVGVWLKEIPSIRWRGRKVRYNFQPRRFEKLVDLGIFHSMCRNAPIQAKSRTKETTL